MLLLSKAQVVNQHKAQRHGDALESHADNKMALKMNPT